MKFKNGSFNDGIVKSSLSFSSSSFFTLLLRSTEFQVGDEDGWVVPHAKSDGQKYNQWASRNRFKVHDTVHFKYEKDSVLVVTEEEYDQCHSSHPIFFSNNGDSVFKLDRPGLFFFISGVSGHCERGQKMIIKVLDVAVASPVPANQTVAAASPKNRAPHVSAPIILLLVFPFAGMLFA